jgi:hypothetical protein
MPRRVWCLFTLIVVVSVALLTCGSVAAHRLNQDVDWYAGAGQWLGALGSLLAAGMALWIATSDRQRADQQRTAEQRERDAELLREASLVRVCFEAIPRRQRMTGKTFHEAVIGITNRRIGHIFDIELKETTIDEAPFRFQFKEVARDRGVPSEIALRDLVIDPGQEVLLFSETPPHSGEYFAVVRYTDQLGRRWQVDTTGGVAKVDADGNTVGC